MPGTTKKERILLIEGDSAFGDRVAEALKKSGYTVYLVKNGQEALKSIFDNLPHLIILDVTMPGADSYEILEKKFAEPMLSKIPVFLLSTQGVPINMRRVPSGSVAEFLMALHIEPSEIVEKVEHQFGHDQEKIASEAAASGPRKKVLWVEDDKLIGSILSKKLISSGFELMHAKNGEEALEMLKVNTPDAIVLDLVLPNMSGFDILTEVRKDQRLAAVPVMILSNLSKQSDIERAKILGAQKFLVKAAVSLDQIVEEIRSLSK